MTKYSKAIQEIINRSEGKSTHAQRLNMLQRQIYDATASLEKVVAHRDPTLPVEAHKMKIAKASKKLESMLETKRRAVDDFRYTAMTDLHTEVATASNLVADPRYSSAILSRFVGMKQKDQISFLNELLSDRDGPSLASILDAPKAATGLSRSHADRIYESYTKEVAPEASAALFEYAEIENALSSTIKAAKRAANEMNNPIEVDRIIREQEKAKEAEQRLNEAMNPS